MRSIGRKLIFRFRVLLALTVIAAAFPGNPRAETVEASPLKTAVAAQRPQASPAKAAASYQAMARQILDETNLARTKPAKYAGYLREMKSRFVGKAYRLPDSTTMVMTSEGVAAVDEAIAYLVKQQPRQPLSWSPGLAGAAGELIGDQSRTGETGHDGSKSGGMRERIERYGTWTGRIGENIGYGPDTARLMVMELIIDDGVADRGHRKNIFSSHFKTAGAACGKHPVYRNMCVMEFATGFQSDGKKK